ncbi:hypothetical protein P8452_02272 [Trifolium repens]|nr:hypothetical protein P8452_02272 [Trifolium repens]
MTVYLTHHSCFQKHHHVHLPLLQKRCIFIFLDIKLKNISNNVILKKHVSTKEKNKIKIIDAKVRKS